MDRLVKTEDSVSSFDNLVRKALGNLGVENVFSGEGQGGLSATGTGREGLSKAPSFSDESHFPLLGVAVSGGADSMALLCALFRIFGESHLKVITIDHGIRSSEESGGDASFVESFCKERGIFVNRIAFEQGAVIHEAQKRKSGIEEAARFLRYRAFDDFISREKLDFLCLAHTQNDQVETVLMRFLKGSACEGLGGIPQKREKIIRPLLDASRAQIESYLLALGVQWRTDSSNSDNRYTRNKIRNTLIPLLDELFPGWKKSVLAGSRKARADEAEISRLLGATPSWKTEAGTDAVHMGCDAFLSLGEGLARRRLYEAFSLIGSEESARVSFSHIEQILALKENNSLRAAFGDVEACVENNTVFIKKVQKTATESGFLAIIEESDTEIFIPACSSIFSVRNGFLVVNSPDSSAELGPVQLPLCIRSAQLSDTVTDSQGKERSVSGVFSAWHIPSSQREKIPLIQDVRSARIIAILGSVFGKENWIDKAYVQ